MKVSLVFIFLLSFLGIAVPTSVFSETTKTNDQVIQDYISKMSAEEKVGQLLMLGILETNFTKSLEKRIESVKPGFLILFRKNIITPLQTANLLHNIQKKSILSSGLQIVVAVDQEGGDVVRIPTKPSLPTALALGRSFDLENTYNIGKYVGEALGVLGIHMNLAPVLDLSDPSELSFIQTRSFGKDPDIVSKISNQFALGVQSSGVVSTAKHFPGLGHLKEDSHKTIVQNNVSKEEFFKSYLAPYKELLKEKSISAVMMTHLVYPNLDPSLKPATFSSPIINVLKKDLNFSGIIITDDVEMAGAKFYKTPEERAVQAFLAGNDVMMVAWNKKSQAAAHRGLLTAYKSGVISEERLHASLEKIIRLKLSLGLEKNPRMANPKIILAKLKDDSLKNYVDVIFKKIMDQELRELANKAGSLDLNRVSILSSDYSFYKKFKSSYKNKSTFIPLRKNFNFESYSKAFKDSDLIVFNVSGPYAAKLANSLSPYLKEKTLVLNTRFLGSIADESSFFDVIQLSMKHSDSGVMIGKILSDFNSQQLRKPSSPAPVIEARSESENF